MTKKISIAISTVSLGVFAALAMVSGAFAQTASPSASVSASPSASPATRTTTTPAGAPATGLGGLAR